MEVPVEVYKIIKCAKCSTVFFTSGGVVDGVLLRLSLMEQIIKDTNFLSTSFSVKHSQTFRES